MAVRPEGIVSIFQEGVKGKELYKGKEREAYQLRQPCLGDFPTFYWLEMCNILLLVATEAFMVEKAREEMTKVILSEPTAAGQFSPLVVSKSYVLKKKCS